MSALDQQLLGGEQIVYRARPHWVLFGAPIALAVLGVSLAVVLQLTMRDYWYLGAGVVGLAAIAAVPPALRYASSDFAVTDKRVLARMGLLHRESLETLLSKIEGIAVEQNVWGRLLGYGTLTITGTGGTRESITCIPRPLDCRRQVQSQIVAQDERRGRPSPTAPDEAGRVARVERDCPWCAEPILARARVCKHCGRDVEPL